MGRVIDIRSMIENNLAREKSPTPVQELINAGEIPRLKGYIGTPGKVSFSIHGGPGEFEMDGGEWEKYRFLLSGLPYEVKESTYTKDGKEKKKVTVSFENPPLITSHDVPLRFMVRGPRISTHDYVRGFIPFKDQVLAMNHHIMLRLLAPIIGNSQFDIGLGDNSIVIAAENLKTIDFENVQRMYAAKSDTTTSLFFQYFIKGVRDFGGHTLPEGLIPNGPLAYMMDTPSTKSAERDITVNPQYLYDNRICTPAQYILLRNSSIHAIATADYFLALQDILLVDNKFEHGISVDGRIKGKDEYITMDSARWWLRKDYFTQLDFLLRGDEEGLVKYLKETRPGIKESEYTFQGKVILCPASYSKQFARDMAKGDQGFTDEQVVEIAVRYVEGIEKLTGKEFKPDERQRDEKIASGLETAVERLAA